MLQSALLHEKTLKKSYEGSATHASFENQEIAGETEQLPLQVLLFFFRSFTIGI